MDWNRREVLGAGLKAGAALAAGARGAVAEEPAAYFGVHSFIEANPKAVFIRRTNVPSKTDSEAKRTEGLKLAREIFVPMNEPGIPLTHRIILKPNHKGTSADFYEGIVTALQELGLKKFHFIEANSRQNWNRRGYVDINRRLGVQMNRTVLRPEYFSRYKELTWSKVHDGVVYQRIPHHAPINEPDTWLLNISMWKSHGMCLTLSVKNEQGMVVAPYVRFCTGWEMVTGVPDFMKPNIYPDVEAKINRYFESHKRMGYSRYDSTHRLSPIRQEIWAHKTCDNMSVLNTGLAMIEGITGRPGGRGANDYLTNLVMFGKDKFRLDLIGLWLGGHEPGNVHWCRIAKERGLTDTFNPWEVPVYEWIDGKAVRRKLTDFTRTPLATYYLPNEGEPEYHLVNEPFDYDKVKI